MSIEVLSESTDPLVVPTISVENSGGDDVTVNMAYDEVTPVVVTIGDGFNQVQLPNGFAYNAGDEVELTPHEFAQISQVAIDAGVVVVSESI